VTATGGDALGSISDVTPGAGGDDVGAKALDLVLRTLRLEQVDADTFRAGSLPWRPHRVYGGQVLAQALLAAGATVVPDRHPHSVHGYFLRPGDPGVPITFAVERLRDGRSFSARRTHALQGGTPILSMIASFQEVQPGVAHAVEMPDLPPPHRVGSVIDLFSGIDNPQAQEFVRSASFDLRHVPDSLFVAASPRVTDRQAVWMRSRAPIRDADVAAPPGDGGEPPTTEVLHAALLAFACDQVLLEPVLRRHGLGWREPGLSVASLDHAMWWHRPARADRWLAYVQESPSAQGGRGLGTARVFTEDGVLVATIAQEGMVRVPSVS
jgi:acyl-CoA thioesterase-2